MLQVVVLYAHITINACQSLPELAHLADGSLPPLRFEVFARVQFDRAPPDIVEPI
jgi:hypothetical protein